MNVCLLKNPRQTLSEFPDYCVEPDGAVRHIESGLCLRTQVDRGGYLSVRFTKKGRRVKRMVHRLVAETYIKKPRNKNEVHHIDHDPSNNHYTNLIWVTPKENSRYSMIEGRKAKKLNFETVDLIKKLLYKGISQYEIARTFSINQSCVSDRSQCCGRSGLCRLGSRPLQSKRLCS